MSLAAKQLSWEPVSKGGTYCAPACGRGCTHKEFVEAHEKGKRMLAALKKPEGWTVEVHENMGWHTYLRKGAMKLYLHGDKYSVLLSSEIDGHGGSSVWTESFSHKDPNKVIARQLQVARAYIKQCQEAIDSV